MDAEKFLTLRDTNAKEHKKFEDDIQRLDKEVKRLSTLITVPPTPNYHDHPELRHDILDLYLKIDDAQERITLLNSTLDAHMEHHSVSFSACFPTIGTFATTIVGGLLPTLSSSDAQQGSSIGMRPPEVDCTAWWIAIFGSLTVLAVSFAILFSFHRQLSRAERKIVELNDRINQIQHAPGPIVIPNNNLNEQDENNNQNSEDEVSSGGLPTVSSELNGGYGEPGHSGLFIRQRNVVHGQNPASNNNNNQPASDFRPERKFG